MNKNPYVNTQVLKLNEHTGNWEWMDQQVEVLTVHFNTETMRVRWIEQDQRVWEGRHGKVQTCNISSKAFFEQHTMPNIAKLFIQELSQDSDRINFENHWKKIRGEKKAYRELKRHPLQPQSYIQDSANRHWVTWQAACNLAKLAIDEAEKNSPQRTWVGLTDDEIYSIDWKAEPNYARAIEAKLKEKNT